MLKPLKPERLRHLDESPIDIYVQYESSDPISLKRIDKVWKNLMGVEYKNHWVMNKNGQ
jgi:ribosomal protein L25 (general stress protein Ctc)